MRLVGRENVPETSGSGDCVYRGDPQEGNVWKCLNPTRRGPCEGGPCLGAIHSNDSDFLSKWLDPLTVVDRFRNPASDVLRNMLAGASVFLVGGGPSANDLPLEDLGRRGVWSMGVNNVAGHARFRPQAFVCSDPPRKFSHSIWYDPGVMKFVPTPKLAGYRARIREKRGGQFTASERTVTQCPNVWAFQRWSWLHPDDRFFTSEGACWG